MISKQPTLHVLALAALAAACTSTSASIAADEPVAAAEPITAETTYVPAGHPYSLVLMRAGDELQVPSREELATLTVDHQAFMREMREDGYMLASGPIVPPRNEPDMRAMFIVDSDDPEAAYERTCSNPASEAGLFDMEAMRFVTTANLRALSAMDRALGMDGTGRVGVRPYVAVSAPTSAAMTALFGQLEHVVVFHGHCTSGTFEGRSIAVLDCNTVGEARMMMDAVGQGSQDFEYHAWVASVSIAELD